MSAVVGQFHVRDHAFGIVDRMPDHALGRRQNIPKALGAVGPSEIRVPPSLRTAQDLSCASWSRRVHDLRAARVLRPAHQRPRSTPAAKPVRVLAASTHVRPRAPRNIIAVTTVNASAATAVARRLI